MMKKKIIMKKNLINYWMVTTRKMTKRVIKKGKMKTIKKEKMTSTLMKKRCLT